MKITESQISRDTVPLKLPLIKRIVNENVYLDSTARKEELITKEKTVICSLKQ
jgi:hypothetical protein